MRIRQKFLAAFLIVSFLIFGFSFAVNILVQEKTFEIFNEIGGKILPGDIALSRMTTELYRTVILLEKFEQTGDIEIRREMEKALSALETHRTTHDLYHSDDMLGIEIEQLVQSFSRDVARYVLLLQKNEDFDKVKSVRKKIDQQLERFLESLNPAIDQSMATSYQKIEDVKTINRDSHIILLAVGIIIVILSLILSFYISLRFSGPLSALRDAAQKIGAGQLNITLPENSKDEVGDLARAFNNMSRDLKDTRRELDDKHQQLQKHKENLEELVYVRTEELQKSNMTLQNTIEELNSAQAQLIETKKMASLGHIVVGVAHEINTPLGVCITAASGIHDELETLDKEFQANRVSQQDFSEYIEKTGYYCEILNDNLNASAKLINSFKQVMIEEENYNIDWCTVNLHDFVDQMLGNMDSILGDYNVQINNRCDRQLELYTSPGALSQIINSLISNSLMHAFEPTDDAQIVLSTQPFGQRIIIDYHDNGKGISEENIQHIFEPFFTTRRGRKDSSGLGLSIIYNLVTKVLKGHIKVQSKPGEGTNFYIELPLLSEQSIHSNH